MELNTEGWEKEKEDLLKTVHSGIRCADINKIRRAIARHFEGDAWLEEQCTPTYPEITVRPSGISTDLYINGRDCIDESIEP